MTQPLMYVCTANSVSEPAQEQASEAGLSKVLIDLISGDRLSSCLNSLSHIMTILEFLSNQGKQISQHID
jgi:hypothetical protein